MLVSLTVRNIALIEKIHIELQQGFHVLTGETGAGKSILVDSLNLVLGERADKEMVRTGTEKGFIEGVFDLSDSAGITAELEEAGIEAEEGLLVVSREISAEGKSVCRLNGRTVTLSFLKKITDRLADIHGQHEHQTLLAPQMHLQFLDSFGGEKLKAQKNAAAQAWKQYRQACLALEQDWGTEEERARKIDILSFQIEEIQAAALQMGEEETLRARREVLQNGEKIRESLQQALSLIKDGSHASLDGLRVAVSALENIAPLDENYTKVHTRVESLFFELEDAAGELRFCQENLEADPQELDRIEDRLALLKKLYRKYGSDIAQVLQFGMEAEDELARLQQAAQTIERLEKEKSAAFGGWLTLAEELSRLRKETAKIFEKRVMEELSQLGMPHSVFQVYFQEHGPQERTCSAEGYDDVEFLLSANAGEPPKPLSKIISGGEMSRFMLALKSIAADDAMLPTMVFDEIDTGISGRMAQVVAEKMAGISRRHQVLCVTHLPQISAMADRHFLISKSSDGASTVTRVQLLEDEARVAEVARLSGGGETDIARQHAREMLAYADSCKKNFK